MYSLNTADDITSFVTKYKKEDENDVVQKAGTTVQSQIDLIKQFDDGVIKGYV